MTRRARGARHPLLQDPLSCYGGLIKIEVRAARAGRRGSAARRYSHANNGQRFTLFLSAEAGFLDTAAAPRAPTRHTFAVLDMLTFWPAGRLLPLDHQRRWTARHLRSTFHFVAPRDPPRATGADKKAVPLGRWRARVRGLPAERPPLSAETGSGQICTANGPACQAQSVTPFGPQRGQGEELYPTSPASRSAPIRSARGETRVPSGIMLRQIGSPVILPAR